MESKNTLILYFTGTGGTERIANEFFKQIEAKNHAVSIAALDISPSNRKHRLTYEMEEWADLLILLYPVYGFDAPRPVYDWIVQANGTGKQVVVISVSGGGEMWPNTGCRNGTIDQLENRGFDVIQDRMMVMPANAIAKINDHAAMREILIVPKKTTEILDSLANGERFRSSHKKDFIQLWLTKAELDNISTFAQNIHCSDACTGCGWCADHCPVGNITMTHKKPVLGEKCALCFRCLYGCRKKALSSTSFGVLKEGFSLDDLEKRMSGVELAPVDKCVKGLFWKAVKEYLQER